MTTRTLPNLIPNPSFDMPGLRSCVVPYRWHDSTGEWRATCPETGQVVAWTAVAPPATREVVHVHAGVPLSPYFDGETSGDHRWTGVADQEPEPEPEPDLLTLMASNGRLAKRTREEVAVAVGRAAYAVAQAHTDPDDLTGCHAWEPVGLAALDALHGYVRKETGCTDTVTVHAPPPPVVFHLDPDVANGNAWPRDGYAKALGVLAIIALVAAILVVLFGGLR